MPPAAEGIGSGGGRQPGIANQVFPMAYGWLTILKRNGDRWVDGRVRVDLRQGERTRAFAFAGRP
ncbi:MAG: hypothetical protein JW929_10495 [Anaerolineales bacterium]|nr:hypothetical protein [Anaerolineales bacterium]